MPATYTVGQQLPNGATVTADSFITQSDGTTVETVTETYPNGSHNQTVITTPGPGTPIANQMTLQQRAQAALVNNATFLALASPTQAQAVAQVQGLTRQIDALIRFALNEFDTTVGT